MENPPTYQQLLAEVYEDTAKNVLVYQEDYEDDDVDEQGETYSDNELDDKEEFNKFQGNRNKPEHVIKPKAKENGRGKASYDVEKHIRTYAINIDGRFRGSITINNTTPSCSGNAVQSISPGTDSAHFLFVPSRQYKNVFSIRITSFEFFNNFYTFTAIDSVTGLGRGNTNFTLIDLGPIGFPLPSPISYSVTVPSGNYVIVDPTQNPNVPNNLLATIKAIIILLPGFSTFTIGIDPVTGIVYFEDLQRMFAIQFPTTTDSTTQNGIGYNLGFYNNYYTSGPPPSGTGNAIYAETNYDAVQDTYVYLKINDWYIIKHQNNDQTEFGAFLKIPLTTGKGTVQFMNSVTNTTAREYYFQQPTNINSFEFQMLDAFGKTLQMNGSTFSVTLEIQEVLQTDIYEKMLEL